MRGGRAEKETSNSKTPGATAASGAPDYFQKKVGMVIIVLMRSSHADAHFAVGDISAHLSEAGGAEIFTVGVGDMPVCSVD